MSTILADVTLGSKTLIFRDSSVFRMCIVSPDQGLQHRRLRQKAKTQTQNIQSYALCIISQFFI